MNPYINVNRIEFVITNSCTSHCKHCSLGNLLNEKQTAIDPAKAVDVVTELADLYAIDSIMTFGGEPLLFADTVCAIHSAATDRGIPSRQIITNGFFTKDEDKISAVAKKLKESGTNSLLLSVDAFHKEHVPIDVVYRFAKAICDQSIDSFRLHPAWVVNREHQNSYNTETEACLAYFADLSIPVSHGNNIFSAGNAAKYLADYYEKKPVDFDVRCGEAPYTNRLDEVECISINPNGDVIVCSFPIGNIYQNSITDIIKKYDPHKNPYTAALMAGGVRALISAAEQDGITIDASQHSSACSICREIMKKGSERHANPADIR